MNKVDQAVSCFKEGFSCSQAIRSAYDQELEIDRATALKISAPFGGGIPYFIDFFPHNKKLETFQ